MGKILNFTHPNFTQNFTCEIICEISIRAKISIRMLQDIGPE